MPFSYDIDPDDSSRSRRRSQHIEKQNSERIEYKALGQNIGQLARGAVAFDPNAEDGDGDGLVQDNTPYERPSVLSNIANTVRQGLASATGSQTYFTNGMSPTVGMTNREVAEHAVPDNPARFLEMRLQQQAILGLTNSNPNIQEDLEKISFDPKGIEQLRNLVERTLDERPALRVAWDRFGVPPIGISEGKNGYAGVFLSDSILMDDDSLKAKPITSAFSNARMISAISSTGLGAPKIKGIKRAFVSTDPRDTITHEWGHYLQQLTSRLHPDRNIREAATLLDARWWDNGSYYKEQLSRHPQLGRLFDYFAEVSKNFSDKQELPDDSVPFVSSAYGTTQPSEFVAEAISAYFSPDKKTRELLNEAGVDLVEKTFLGIRGGLASTSSGRRTTTGSSMRGLTPEQMAERIVPSTLEEAILSMEDHQKMMAINGEGVNTEALKLVVPKGVDDLDFSPEAVKEMREVITKALAENRMFRDVVERHGFPPVLATKRGAKWVDGDGTYAVSMIEGFPSIIVNRDSRNQILLAGGAPNGIFPEEGKLEGTNSFLVGENENSLMAHEWGHYINRLAASIHPDPEIRALATFWFSDTWDHDAGLTGPWKALDKLGINVGDDKASQRIIGARRFSEKVKKSKSEKWTGYPHVLSQYGQTMPAEAFAEGVSAILVGDESARGLVSPALKDDIFDIIGKPESYQRDIAGGISERRAGLASVSIPRDPTTGIIIVPNNNLSPSAQSTPLGGRDWLKDGTNDEIADILSVRSMEDFVNLTLMNMLYGQSPDSITGIKNMMEEGIIFNFFPETRGEPGFLIDFSPKGIDRTRQIINSALDASPEFAWIVRQFGSVPIVTIDPDAVDSALSREILDPITGSPVTKLVSDYSRSKSIGGWSIGMFGIVLNTSSKYGRRRLPVGQRSRTTYYDANSQSVNEEYLGNVDLSMEGTLYHEWFHSFYGRIIGWHQNLRTTPGIPGQRQDRQDYLYPGVADAASITKLIKETFDSQRFIPYSTTVEGLARPILEKAARDIARAGDTLEDFISIMGNHETALGPNGALWTPEISRNTLDAIRARYPYLVADLAPLINVKYGTATRQEQFAETGTLFVTPDRRQRSNYLSPELEALYAYILGLKPDTSPGDYNRPWEQRSGLASRSTKNQHAISSLNERVHTGRELFVQAGEAHRRPDVVGSSAGMTDISINGYKFSIMGELPEWQEAYDAWNDWQENWRMRYISSEIMGLGALSSQADTRRWQSTANNHLKNGTINEAPSDIKEEIQRSAMMSLSIMKEIADSPYATDSPLYRSVNNVRDTDAIAGLNVGQTLSMPLTSFSPDYASVLGFSNSDDQTSIADAMIDRSNVIIKLREGTSVIYSPVSKPTPDTDGREVNMPIEAITAGEFVVKSRTTVNGVDVIEIEQSRVIDPLRGSRATDGRKKVEINKRRIKLNQDMTKSLQKIREKIQDRENANTNDEINNIDDDIAFEGKRYGTITRALRTRNDDFDKLDTPRTVGGLASTSSLENRAKRHGVSLEAFNDEGYDADDIEWSTNDWSLGKTNQVRAGDVVVVRTRSDGKKEILTIERKSGPFRGALSLPGGLQDEGEDLYDTAEREMLEEVNVSPTDAMDRRILGQVDVKDWDPRFVEGGRIAGIRFDLSEEQSSVVKAGDDAGKFEWIDVEEMSTGKYPIAFGHASWLAEAFADDEVLGPRFAVLAEASRVRNQRLIKKIDEKRREKGVKEFGEMPDPSAPYNTTTDGIRTGLASARSGVKDISPPMEVTGTSSRLMKENEDFLNDNPINDGYYGRVIDGAWAKKMANDLKYEKISHEDAVGIYLVLNAINEAKIYDSPESIEEAFAIRTALNKIRNTVSGNEEHFVKQYRRDGKTTWGAYRGQDYLGDYDSEEEALAVVQDSIADRTMIGPTRPAGLASSSGVKLSRNETDIARKAKEILYKDIDDKRAEIDELKDTNSRLRLAMEELQATGSWQGEKYDVRVNDHGIIPPVTWTREQLEADAKAEGVSFDDFLAEYVEDIEAADYARQYKIDQLQKKLDKAQENFDTVTKERSDKSFHMEELLAIPEIKEEILRRREEVLGLSYSDRDKRWSDPSDPDAHYVIHWGASQLIGGELDPTRSRGVDGPLQAENTRSINLYTARPYVEETARIRETQEITKKVIADFAAEKDMNVGPPGRITSRERKILEDYNLGSTINDDGTIKWDEIRENLGDGYQEWLQSQVARIQEDLDTREPRIARRERISAQLVADEYQYSSAYNARALTPGFSGYGGRYADEGAEIGTGASSGDRAPKSPITGIHIFRVTPENATSLGGGEVHLIGKHTPIATLVAKNDGMSDTNPAVNAWEGWVDMAIQQDIQRRAGLASASRSSFSDTKSRYMESLNRNIADASDYISRLEDALDEWDSTGVWRGADYGVVLTPGRPMKNMTREQMLEIDYNPDNFAGAIQNRIDELGIELSDMQASRARLDKQGPNTTPIEAILDDPDVLARIEKRAAEVSAMSRPERSELFRDGEYEYVVHWGADVLESGVLDPARSRGDETSASTVGNTRRINKVTAMQLVANRDDQKKKLADLTKIQQEFEETGLVNLSSAENPFGIERLIGSLISRGKDRNPSINGDRAYRPFPDADDLDEMDIDELTPEMRENIATIIERSRNSSEQTLTRLDKVADKLIEDDYQYSSTYPAEKLRTANGYGGRYGEEGDSWKNAPQATRTGVHVFRVRIGEDATRDTGGPDEVHIIGQHTPIASLSVETHKNTGNQPGSAQGTWQGWLAEVVEADKASRSGLASTANLNPEQRDVYSSIRERVRGLASRGDSVNPVGKSAEEIAQEIELSPEEMKILETIIPNADQIASIEVNIGISGAQDRLIDSVRVTVGEDGIPFIYAEPHPLLAVEIPDKRDWSSVLRPKSDTAQKIKDVINMLADKFIGDDSPDVFWGKTTSNGDKREEIETKQIENDRLLDEFSAWAKGLLAVIADEKQGYSPQRPEKLIADSNGTLTWLGIWAEGLRDLSSPLIRPFLGSDDLNAHDIWGHLGSGRGFDRHGEWANMLVMFSLMDRWAKENGISKDDLTKAKAYWFQSFELRRIDGEFRPTQADSRSQEAWYIRDWAIEGAINYADPSDLEELVSLLDDGNTHNTNKSMGLASTSGSELAEIAKTDIVRQSLKEIEASRSGLASAANLTPEQNMVYTSIQRRVAGLASRSTPTNPVGKNTEEIAKEIELSPEEMKILEELIPDADKIANIDVNPALKDLADELLDSVRVAVGDDGIPFIYASPHPLLSDEIPDKRDWSTVVRPKKETIEKIKELINSLVKKSMGEDTLEEFWSRSQDGDKYETIKSFNEETTKLRESFTLWAQVLLKYVTENKQQTPSTTELKLFNNQGTPTWLGMWAEGLRDLSSPNVLTFLGDNELTSHDVWGHLGTGRGFDRHGEYANMLAMFSLMDRWAEERGISKEQVIKLKASWFKFFEFERIDGEFKPPSKQIRQEDKWYMKQWAIDSAIYFADTSDLEKLISLLDDGNKNTGTSKGLASTSGSELAEIAKNDIVRQSLKEIEANGESAITLSEDGRMPDMPVRDSRSKTMPWVELSTKSFINDAPSFDIKSLNYTKPELRERIKNRIMAGSKGGRPGQWSARKAQLLAMEYREAGGGYRGGLRKTQRSLKKWTREKWTTSDGKPAIRKGGTRRYLPASAWSKLTPAERRATNRKKIIGSRGGNQFVANTRSAENASRRARD